MSNQIYPPVPLTPPAYWVDSQWADEHIADLAQAYPNLWVAVIDKQVVASGKVIAEVRRTAEAQSGKTHFPIIFAERGIHVYTNQPALPNPN